LPTRKKLHLKTSYSLERINDIKLPTIGTESITPTILIASGISSVGSN